MKQKRIFCKRLLTLLLCLAMVFTSVNIPSFTVQAAVKNEYEAKETDTLKNGATYDAETGEVTFYVKSADACYEEIPDMWYQEFESYEEAASKHITSGNGDFIAGLDPKNLIENDDQTEKSLTVKVSEGTVAILYYFRVTTGERPDYEHIIVIDEADDNSDDVATEDQKEDLKTLAESERTTVDKGNVDEYTEDSWAAYVDAVEKAEAVLASESATVKEVKDALKALQDAKAGLKKEGGSVVMPEPSADAINLEEKFKLGVGDLSDTSKGIGTWLHDQAEANWSYEGTKASLTSSKWTEINWWGIQWAINGIDVTPGEWTVEFDIVSTIDKPAYFKVTRFDEVDASNDILAGLENGNEWGAWQLKANEPQHIKLTGTVDITGKVRFFFNLAGGNGEGTVIISNVTWTQTPGTEQEKAPVLTTDKVSKQNGYKVGESPELAFTDDETWRNAVTAVKVNNHTAEEGKYTLEAGKLTLNASLFAKQNVYKIEVEADGYETATLMLPVYAASVANEKWKQEWADEFDGNELDPQKWDYEIGVKSGDDATSDAPVYWGNNEKEYYTKEALKVENGKLVITATELTDELRSKYNITDSFVKYSSARIRTVSEDGSNTLFATTYGRIEAAMELPDAKGYWPAFWMLPTNETVDIYGTWASSGELDIMEAGQTADTVDGTIHYGSTWPNDVHSGGHYTFPEAGATANSHVYAVEWEPGEIRWYVDDILYHIENNWYAKGQDASSNYAYPAPYDEDFYILFNLAISGQYIGGADPDELGKSMKVDYVRVFKDENMDYGKEPEAPDVDRDNEFFEANKQYADNEGNYIQDVPYDTIKDHIVTEDGFAVELGYWISRALAENGATAETDVVEKDGVKYAKIDVTKKGANNYDVQLIQHVPLARGYTYRLTFDAYTDVPGGRNFSIAPKGDGDNGWKGYDSGITANLTDKVQSYECIFTMSSDSDPTARIEANIGNTTGAVYIGNMKLVALSKQDLEDLENEKQNGKKTPLDNGEHIYNGGFDQGTGRFAYWNKEGDYEVDTSNRSMKATITSSSSIDDVTLKQPGIQLLQGDDYKLTLKAKADSAKDIKVGLYSKDGTVYAEKTYHIDSEMEELVLEFTMDKEVTDEEAVLIIAFGGDTTSVEIDDVSMKRLSNRNAEWNAALLYPLGGETWSVYNYYVWGWTNEKPVPENGVITESAQPTADEWNYMILAPVTIQPGYTYKLGFDIKSSKPDQTVTAKIEDSKYTPTMQQTVVTTTEWQTVNTEFTSTLGGGSELKFLLSDSQNAECDFSIRNVTLEIVGGPYLVLGRIPAEMLVGDTLQLNPKHAVEVNADYENYTYQSSDEAVATVSKDGLITAVAAGSAKITVTSGAGATKSFTIKVVSTLSKGDKTELIELLAEYKDYNENDYTEESWKVFAKALEDAKKVVDNPDATQNDVDEALYNLEEAAAGLKPAEADKEALNESIAKYEDSEKYKEEDYTAESWAEFAKALKDAKAVAAKADATQQEVDNALAALEKAANALKGAEEEPGPGPEKKEGLWIAEIPDQTYTGAAIKPVIQVYDGETLLKEKTDYTVTYKKNTNVGTAEVTVKGKGNYAKAHTETFNIVPKNIADEDIIAPDVYAILSKNGTVKTPKISLKYGKKTLKAAAKTKENDYSAVFEIIPTNEEDGKLVAGHYTITVTGHGNYTGTREIGYDVLPDSTVLMSKVTVNLSKTTVTYADDGQTEKPEVTSVTYGKGAKMVTLDPDQYEVEYEPVVKLGKVAVVVTAKAGSGYYGSKSQTYTVTGTAFKAKDFDVTGISAEGYTYTGEEITPELTVLDKNNQKVLEVGRDYDVTYSKNTNVGKATITLTGKGGYTGKFTTTFNITKMDLGKKNEEGSGLVWTCEESAVYTQNKAVPEYTLTYNGTPLTEKKDYKVTCKKNTEVTSEKTAEITITGIGNFTGTISETYAVTTPDASSIYAVASDVTVPKAVNKLKASLKVYEESTGKALKAGTDYEKTFQYYVLDESGESRAVTADDLKKDTLIHATITLKKNYAGSGENAATIETTFRLYETKASKLTVDKIPMQVYTGKEIRPEVTVYADKAKTQKLTEGVDYEVEYSNNIKKGTAKVTITGIGNGYGGVKKVTFKIGTKSMAENANWFTKATESIADFFKNMF